MKDLSHPSFSVQREWTVDGIPILTASVLLPKALPVATSATRRIHRYYHLQSRAYLRYCENWLFPQARAEYYSALESSAPLPSFRAELTYRNTYDANGLWSLYTQSRETTLPGLPLLTHHGDTWSLADGFPLSLASFFAPRFPWKRRLLSLAEEEICRQEAAGISLYHENWRRELRRQFNPQNFYLSANGLTFFFPMYTLAPAVEGIPSFTLPWDTDGLRSDLSLGSPAFS